MRPLTCSRTARRRANANDRGEISTPTTCAPCLAGGTEKDTIRGGAGADRLSGDEGDDQLLADDGAADKSVDGGEGQDSARIDAGLDVGVTSVETFLP